MIKLTEKAKGYLRLGQIIFTTGARNTLDMDEVQIGLMEHQMKDWGDISEEYNPKNDKNAGKVLSSYISNGIKFWIITELDRSVTTILLPSEH